jgi:hypothetical protein
MLGRKLKDENKQNNSHELISLLQEVVCFFEVLEFAKNMSAESVIGKLQRVTREKKT